jgi:hypothetical protein
MLAPKRGVEFFFFELMPIIFPILYGIETIKLHHVSLHTSLDLCRTPTHSG